MGEGPRLQTERGPSPMSPRWRSDFFGSIHLELGGLSAKPNIGVMAETEFGHRCGCHVDECRRLALNIKAHSVGK